MILHLHSKLRKCLCCLAALLYSDILSSWIEPHCTHKWRKMSFYARLKLYGFCRSCDHKVAVLFSMILHLFLLLSLLWRKLFSVTKSEMGHGAHYATHRNTSILIRSRFCARIGNGVFCDTQQMNSKSMYCRMSTVTSRQPPSHWQSIIIKWLLARESWLDSNHVE